jgi:Thymidylate synthase
MIPADVPEQALASTLPDRADTIPPVGLRLTSPSLHDLLAQAAEAVLRGGEVHHTQRGDTRSLNGVMLTWQDAAHDRSPTGQWGREDVQWYLDVFVALRPENDPARLAPPGALVFPYTYAARTRFWDGGWGYLSALVAALRDADIPPGRAARSSSAFSALLAALGERLHLQTVLSLCALYPSDLLDRWLREPDLVTALRDHWRRDTLAAAIHDIAQNPHSRRAVVASLCYPHLEEQLQPRMALPPYQLFQLLPGEPDSPLHSIHVHRSLDVAGGAPLDFYHDLAWLREASARVGRPVGDITVVAHNLHAYEVESTSSRPESIEQWLCRVTDGYIAGRDMPGALLAQPAYRANAERVWAHWQERERTL